MILLLVVALLLPLNGSAMTENPNNTKLNTPQTATVTERSTLMQPLELQTIPVISESEARENAMGDFARLLNSVEVPGAIPGGVDLYRKALVSAMKTVPDQRLIEIAYNIGQGNYNMHSVSLRWEKPVRAVSGPAGSLAAQTKNQCISEIAANDHF